MASSTAALLAGGSGGGGASRSGLSGMRGGIEQILALNRFNNRSAAANTAIAQAANTSDPNNLSAMGIGSSNIVQSNMMPLTPGMSEVGVPPTINSTVGNIPSITTGGFSPQTQQVAQGIYGDELTRQTAVAKKPLINIL